VGLVEDHAGDTSVGGLQRRQVRPHAGLDLSNGTCLWRRGHFVHPFLTICNIGS